MSPVILIDAIRREKAKRAAESSLVEFTKQAWPIIEPGMPFISNWHIDAIAEHLEAVSVGEINNLLINIPPGCMKSILVSVMWPSWEWILNPSLRILGASYGEDLAVRDARKTRDIITSEWFLQNWPHVQIVRGDDQKTKYSLTERGWRMATSVGGRATGEHPDRKIVDDPHSSKQAQSDAERGTALAWFDQTLATRGVSRNAATVVVMQRLHEQDISGHILADIGGYEHLFLPMRYEAGSTKKATCLGFTDPRSVEGGLLWPEMFPEEKLKKLETSLGQYGTAGQLQQRPSPAGGGILKVKCFKLWPSDKKLPDFDCVVQSWDTAFTEKTTGDPSACTVWGTMVTEGKQCAMLLDAKSDNMAYPVLKKAVIEDWANVYGENKRHADFILVEKKASGQSIIQDLQVAGLPVRGYNPGNADKVSRAHMVAPILEMEVIYILESSVETGQPVKWARPFIKECEDFPNAAHDDAVDTFTQVIIYFRDAGLIASPAVEEEEDDEEDYHVKKQRTNPYSR
jgi:predicted phage terminase large subunit-like protein